MNHTKIQGGGIQNGGIQHVPGYGDMGASQVVSTRDVSEFERESQAVEAQIMHLEERFGALRRRLEPVLSQDDSAAKCAGKAEAMVSSPIGSQLRNYSNRIENIGSAIDYVLSKLVLP